MHFTQSEIQQLSTWLGSKPPPGRMNVLDEIAPSEHAAIAAGTSTLDVAPLINNMVATLAEQGGGTLSFSPGTYLSLSTTTLASNVTIEGNGATLDSRTTVGDLYTLYAEGTVASPVTPRVDILYGAEFIEVPTGSFAVGDWIEIGANKKYMGMEDNTTPNIGQCNMVIEVEASGVGGYDKVWLDSKIYGDITAGQRFKPSHIFHYNGTTYTDLTLARDGQLQTGNVITFTAGNYIYIGQRSPFDAIFFRMQTYASPAVTLSAQYIRTDGTWVTATISTDGTSGLTAIGTIYHNARGTLRASLAADWVAGTVNSISGLFWLRLSASATVSAFEIREIECFVCSGYMLADGAYAQKRTPIENVTVRNLNILGDVAVSPMVFYRCHNLTLENVHLFGAGSYAVAIGECDNVLIQGGRYEADRTDDTEVSGGINYGIGIGGFSRNIKVIGTSFHRFLHAIVGVAAENRPGVPRNISVITCDFSNGRGWGGINGHGTLERLTITNNHFHNIATNLLATDANYRRAINLTGAHIIITGNQIAGFRYGVSVSYGSHLIVSGNQMDGVNVGITIAGFNMGDVIIDHNIFRNVAEAIELNGTLQHIIIDHNQITRYSSAGVSFTANALITSVLIDGNMFYDNTGSTASNPFDLATGSVVADLKIVNNHFRKTYSAPIIQNSGTISNPYLWSNSYEESFYQIENHVQWMTRVVRVPVAPDFGIIIADGAYYEMTGITLEALRYDETTPRVSDRVLAIPDDRLDLLGCTYRTIVTADKTFTLRIYNDTGASVEISGGLSGGGYWFFRLIRFYE